MSTTFPPAQLRLLRAMLRKKARVRSNQVCAPLTGQQRAINLHIADQHFEAPLKGCAGDFAISHVGIFAEAQAVGEGPGVTLARDSAELVGHRKTSLVGSNNGGEQFAREFMPEMIKKILQCAADAAVIVRRAQHDYI